ncbi:Hypothetical protein CINCED_3A008880 [Cinara cedri]|uniref:Fanconi anemia group D2 protein n=1 Tax=Cinara cedri TaxID=506608 RepID=A0A5E4MDE9_9HEMI|nr:Hypothetical protein CINCED_3A008880 [Cinara cedri]
MSLMSQKNVLSDEESPESPSMLEDLTDLPNEKKRKTMTDNEDNTINGSQALFDENNDPHAYLKQTLFSCGLHLKCDQNILSVEEYIFLQKLKSKLSNDSEEIGITDVVNKFFKEFEAYHNDKITLYVVLSPCKAIPEKKLKQQKDSLARLLLQVPQLQSNLIDFLFDKMAEISLEDFTEDSILSIHKWVRLLLKPFKQLYSIMDLKKVCNKLFDNLNVMPDIDIKRELVMTIPDIVLDNIDHDAHDELCKLLRNDKDLMACILETIGQLNISKTELAFIQMDLIPMIHHTPLDVLPALVRFLINVDDRTVAEKIVNGLRSELPFSTSDSISQMLTNDNMQSLQLVIFSCIYDKFLSSKLLLDVWIKIISQVQSHAGHKPLDVVILFLTYSAASHDISTKNTILSVFKERLKNGFFRYEIMEKTFQIFTPVFKQYFEMFIDLFSNLLKATDHVSIEVVTSMIVNCFINIDQCWCKWMVDELLVLLGTGNKLTVENVLNILTDLAEKRIDKIQPLATRLMSVFMNKIYDFSTKDIAQVLDMLCKIAYSEGPDGINNCSVFQDEINIFVQKELCALDIISQRVGIIGAIMLTKHIVLVSSDQESIPIDKSNEDNIVLSKKAKEAYSLIELLVTRTQSDTDSQILFFDQFALMLFHGLSFDNTFMFAVSSVMKKNFQYSFLIAANDFKNGNFLVDCSLAFCLDKELDEIIALNLCPKVIDEVKKIDNALMGLQSCTSNALMSMFRLVRGLEREDLSEIDALLGCPLVMPTRKTIEEFEMLSPEQQIVVVNTLFHAVNWFREVINCFSYLIKQKNGSKVLIRLRTIVYLIKEIKKCLSVMYEPEYIPPSCYYGLNVDKPIFNKIKKKPVKAKQKSHKKSKKIVKEKKNKSQEFMMDESIVDDSNDINVENEVDISIYHDYFRELDIDTWLILTQKFVVNPTPENNEEFTPELGPSELRYLLEDVLQKLEHVVFKNKKISPLSKTKYKDTVGFNSVSLIPTKTLIRNFIKLFPYLFSDLETLSAFFKVAIVTQYVLTLIIITVYFFIYLFDFIFLKNLLMVNDNILDSPGMFMKDAIDMKHCVGLIFKCIVVLLQWKDFQSSDTDELFIHALKKMINKTDLSSQSTQFKHQMCKKGLILEKIKYLNEFQHIVLHLDAAVNLVTIIQILKNFAVEPENDIILNELCWNFLTRQWYLFNGLEESGPKYNENIQFLLEIYLQCQNDQLNKLVEIVDWLEEETLAVVLKTDRLKTLPTINKMNFKCLIKVILNSLLSSVKNSLKSSESEFDRLTVWHSAIYVMEKIVQTIKKQDSRFNLLIFVKGSILLLKLFLAEGMIVCQNLIKLRTKEVSKVLKNLQVITRYIQNICNYTKVVKDNALSNCLPNIRGILETLILKVKNLIVVNGCTDALFMGIMKNIDIKGEEILSQNDSDDDEEDEDDNISEDKDEADNLIKLLGDDKTQNEVEEEDSDNSSIL